MQEQLANSLQQEFVTVKGAMKYLDCSMPTIYRLMKLGLVNRYKLLGGTRLKISELEGYIVSQLVAVR